VASLANVHVFDAVVEQSVAIVVDDGPGCLAAVRRHGKGADLSDVEACYLLAVVDEDAAALAAVAAIKDDSGSGWQGHIDIGPIALFFRLGIGNFNSLDIAIPIQQVNGLLY
jgi:hypothetical protein